MAASSDSQARTLAAYEAGAGRYIDDLAPEPPEHARAWLSRFAASLPTSAAVLEIGSGPGRDAASLEACGLTVQRTDAARAFVDRLIDQGHSARVCNVLTDDLGGPWDGIWANAVLLHLTEPELGQALARLLLAARPGGRLGLSVKEGDGESHDNRRIGLPRYFRYWRAEPLSDILSAFGWQVDELELVAGRRESWLQLLAHRPE